MAIELDPIRVSRLQNTANQIGDTDSGEAIFAGLYAAGRLRDIKEDPTKWGSSSRASEGTIIWGTGLMGPQLLEDVMFGNVDEPFAKTHRLLHEMGHLTMIQSNEKVVGKAFDLYETLDIIRAKNTRILGLSAIASRFYTQNRAPHEDAAELFGMLTHDEDRYRAYMRFMKNDSPGMITEKARHGVATISSSEAQLLDRQLRSVHEEMLL